MTMLTTMACCPAGRASMPLWPQLWRQRPATGLAATLFGLPAVVGVVIGLAAMLGDLLSSFVKRRLGMASSSMAFGLDQIPEAWLPLLAVSSLFELTRSVIAGIVAGFVVLELALSRLLYWLGIRKRPY